MKLVIQRVSHASISVKGNVVSKIGKGLFVLVGIGKNDSKKDAEQLAEKLFKLRIMQDSEMKMNLTVNDADGEFLIVSQFTLYADTSGGNRPSFIDAARPEIAEPLYNYFVEQLKGRGIRVETGVFGEYMEIELTLDGPVTIIVDSDRGGFVV